MAERTTVTQVVQIGLETTEGTAVAAGKTLPSINILPAIAGNVDAFTSIGNKWPTIHVLGEEWSASAISGKPTYDEVVYLLSSLLSKVTPAQQSGTTAYKSTASPSSTAPDTIDTFTIENGSSVRAHKSAGNFVSDLTLTFSRSAIDLSGTMMGKAITDGITLTASPTAVPQIPLLPAEIEVWLDTTAAGLGTTKLLRVLSGSIQVNNRFGPLWVADRSQASYVAHVELPIAGQVKLMLEADAAGMALLTNMRAGSSMFMRFKTTSSQLAGTAIPYSFQWDNALQVASPPSSFQDQSGVYAIEWTFDIVHDPTWGKATTVDIVNTRTAL